MGIISSSLHCVALCLLLLAQERAVVAQTSERHSAGSPTRPLKLSKGTFIAFELLERVSSADARNGQTIRLAVREDVKESGVVLIPKGSPATGVVRRLSRAAPGKRNGFFRISPVRITLPDGREVRMDEFPPGEDSCGSGGSCRVVPAPFVPFILLGLGGIRDGPGPKKDGVEKVLPASSWAYGYTQKTVRINPAVP